MPPSAPDETYSHALLALLKYFADQVRGEFLGKPKPKADWLRFGQKECDIRFEKTPLEVSHLLKRFHEVEKYQQARREKLVKSLQSLAAAISIYAGYSIFLAAKLPALTDFLQTCGYIVVILGGWAFLQHLIFAGNTPKEFRVSPFKHLPAHLSPAILERITLLTQTIEELQQNIKTINTWKKRLESEGTRRLVGNRMISIARHQQIVKITVGQKDDEFFREGPRTLKFEFSTEAFEALIAEHQKLKSLGESLLASLKSQLSELVILAKENSQMQNIEEVLAREIDVEAIALLADFLLIRKPLKILNNNKPSKAEYTRFLERVAMASDGKPKRN